MLDTWFSSALWPFATLGWPDDTPALRAFYPTDVLVTARDIIFLWVARMVMMGETFVERDPFEDVYITPIIQAPDGRRMSKSLGTGIDPLDEIGAHGADARALRAARDGVVAGRPLLAREDPAGPAAREQDVERVAADPAERRRTSRARRGRVTAEDRWILLALQRAIERGHAS